MDRQYRVSLSWVVRAVAVLAACVLLVSAAARAYARPGVPRVTAFDSISENPVADWSALLAEDRVFACAGPEVESRMASTVNIAMYDALNAIAPDSPQIAFHGREPAAYARAAIAWAASTSLVEVLRTAPRLSMECRRTSIFIVKEAAEASMEALPDRPATWIGVVLGKATATASLSWTSEHPAGPVLVCMRLAGLAADEHDLTMWDTAALLAACSTTSWRRSGSFST